MGCKISAKVVVQACHCRDNATLAWIIVLLTSRMDTASASPGSPGHSMGLWKSDRGRERWRHDTCECQWNGAHNRHPIRLQLYGAMLEQQKSRGTKTCAKHVQDEQNVWRLLLWEREELWSQRQVAVLNDSGWSDNQRTADKTKTGLEEQYAANWAPGEKPERGVSVFLHLVSRVNERAAAQSGKRESLSGGMCMQSCHLVFGTERMVGRDPKCQFPTASGHCSRGQQPIVVLA